MKVLRSIADTLRYYLHGIVEQMTSKLVFIWAQAIAFKVLVAVVPVLILTTGILGSFLRRSEPFRAIERAIREFLPPYQSDQLVSFLYDLQSAGGTLTLIGGIGLFLTAVTLFTTLRVAIASVFQEDWHKTRTILGGYAFDVRMVLQVGLFFILTVFVSTFNTLDAELLRQLGLDYDWLMQGARETMRYFGVVLPFLLTFTMFFQLLYFVPKPHPPKRCALLGTLVTAVLWEVAKTAFTIYASNVGQFDRYQNAGTEGLAGLGSAFGLIIAFVFWAYFSGVVLIVGAIVALLSEKKVRTRRRLAHAEETRRRLAARARERTTQQEKPTDSPAAP